MADGPKDKASLPGSGIDTVAPDPDAGLFSRLKAMVRDSLEQHSNWYTEAEECFAFVAGRGVKGAKGQWPDDSWQEMIDSGRQPVEFNRIGPMVDSICGLEINNRQEVKYLPRTQGDAEVDERLSSLGDWARDEANAEDEESEMFRHSVICGRGATETRIDFSEEPTGKIVVDNLDPMECGVDPAARKAALSDRRYSWRFRDVPTDEAKAMFTGMEPTALHASWASTISTKDGGEGNKTDYPEETRAGLDRGEKPKTVRIVQIEWWEQATSYLVAVPGQDQPQEISEDGHALLMEQTAKLPPEQQPQVTKQEKRRYRKAFLGKNGVLDCTDVTCFQINWTTGRYDRNKGYHYGWVRPMRDPQMLGNKTLSQVLHILNTNAKGGLLIEKGAFANARDAEKDWSNPAKSIVLNEGGIAKIKDRTPPPLPQSLVQLQEFAITSIRDVTGTNVEMLGMADRNQPASLEYQRRQSAMTILASLFNGLRHYRKLQGRTMLEQLKLLPPGVLVRVLIDPQQAIGGWVQQLAQWHQAVGLPFQPPMQLPTLEQAQAMFDHLTQMVPALQQHMAGMAQSQGQPPQQIPPPPEPPSAEFMSTTKQGEQFDPAKFGLGNDTRFDVIIDEAPSSPNQKEATWAALQPFVDKLPPQAMPIVLEASPLPESMAKELGDILAKAGGPPEVPPQIQQMIDQGKQQIAELQQENQQLKDKSQIDAAKVGVQQQDAATRRMKVVADAQPANDIEELKGQVAMLAQAVHGIITQGMGG